KMIGKEIADKINTIRNHEFYVNAMIGGESVYVKVVKQDLQEKLATVLKETNLDNTEIVTRKNQVYLRTIEAKDSKKKDESTGIRRGPGRPRKNSESQNTEAKAAA